jgi:hypothetical protein
MGEMENRKYDYEDEDEAGAEKGRNKMGSMLTFEAGSIEVGGVPGLLFGRRGVRIRAKKVQDKV